MDIKIHKINSTSKASLSVILPHRFSRELQIQKGDFVKIRRIHDKIIIEKLEKRVIKNRDCNNSSSEESSVDTNQHAILSRGRDF